MSCRPYVKPIWRVIVRDANGSASHESRFVDLISAQRYYDALIIPGSAKALDVRGAYRNRFFTLQREDM